MRRHLTTAVLFTLVTTFVFGLLYPLGVTVLAQFLMPQRANGQLLTRNGQLIGSKIIGQPFTAANYFHSRPSAAGTGYDSANSSGSNFGPTNKKLIDRVAADVAANQLDHPNTPVPIDLVTSSASGLDPDITPAAAEFQIARIARERHLSDAAVRTLVATHTQPRQFGLLGEPRVNVLALNLALDDTK